ncbi:methyltransferase family protein [Winogradskyella sp.]
MNLIIQCTIIAFYVSLILELFYYSVPSIVVTKRILRPNAEDVSGFSQHKARIFRWSFVTKLVVFVIPLVFIYLLHLLPAFLLYELSFNKVSITSNLMVIAGLFLVIFGRIFSHIYLSKINAIKANMLTDFISTGIFKYSRNPGLIGLYISFLGFFMIKPSILYSICFVIYIIHMHFKILLEEDYLMNLHGDKYLSYKKKIRRYL